MQGQTFLLVLMQYMTIVSKLLYWLYERPQLWFLIAFASELGVNAHHILKQASTSLATSCNICPILYLQPTNHIHYSNNFLDKAIWAPVTALWFQKNFYCSFTTQNQIGILLYWACKTQILEGDWLMFGTATQCVKGVAFQGSIRRQQLQGVFHLSCSSLSPWLILLFLN